MLKTHTIGEMLKCLRQLEDEDLDAYEELCKSPIRVAKTFASFPHYAIIADAGESQFCVAFAKDE